MNILFTVHTYYPNKDGVQYVSQYLCEGLVKKGHAITVLTVNKEKDFEFEHNGVKIISKYFKTKFSMIIGGKNEYINTFRKLALNADVLINCCVQSPNNNCILRLLPSVSASKVLYLHGMHYFKILKQEIKTSRYLLWHILINIRWYIFYKKNAKYFRSYDHVIDISSNSPAIGYLRNLGVNCDISVIKNAVEDFENIRIVSAKMYPVLERPYFLCVANYSDLKNQDMLISAFDAIEEKKTFELVCIGASSKYSSFLKNKYKGKYLIHILEDKKREETREFIKNATCCVLSSQKEVYPIFLCEGIMCGHPYISTDVGCVSSIQGGIIVNSEPEMSMAMKKIIENKKYATELGNIGRQFAIDNLSQKQKINELELILNSTLEKE